jgi:hypothetical protein
MNAHNFPNKERKNRTVVDEGLTNGNSERCLSRQSFHQLKIFCARWTLSPIAINLQWPAVDDQSGCLGRAHPRMGGVAQQESGNTNYQCPCPTGANALGAADANTAHISFILDLCRPARKCGSLNHRSHFGSRYKLGVQSRTPFWVWVQAHRHQSELHGHWRGLDSGTGAPQAACLLTTSTSMRVRQAARLLLT